MVVKDIGVMLDLGWLGSGSSGLYIDYIIGCCKDMSDDVEFVKFDSLYGFVGYFIEDLVGGGKLICICCIVFLDNFFCCYSLLVIFGWL